MCLVVVVLMSLAGRIFRAFDSNGLCSYVLYIDFARSYSEKTVRADNEHEIETIITPNL